MAEGDRKAGSGRARGRRETTLVTLRAHRRKLLVVAACVAAAAALVAAGLSGAFLPQVEVPWLVGTDAGAAYAALQEAGFTRIEGRKRAVGGDGVETSCDLSAETSGMTVIAERPDMGAVRTDTPITLVVESASEREKLESAQAEVAAWQERVSAMARELADWQSARRLSSTDVLQLEPRTTSGQSLASSLVALEDALSGYESGGMSDVDLELPDGLQQSSVTDDGGALFLEVACTWKDAAGATHDGVCKAKVVGAPLVRDDVVPAYAVLDLEIS